MVTLDEIKEKLDATAWFGVGVIGVALFVLGIFRPALGRFSYGSDLGLVVAFAGGAVALLGFSFGYDQREAARAGRGPARPLKGRAREIAIAPSFEVYRPGAVERPPLAGESPPGDDEAA